LRTTLRLYDSFLSRLAVNCAARYFIKRCFSYSVLFLNQPAPLDMSVANALPGRERKFAEGRRAGLPQPDAYSLCWWPFMQGAKHRRVFKPFFIFFIKSIYSILKKSHSNISHSSSLQLISGTYPLSKKQFSDIKYFWLYSSIRSLYSFVFIRRESISVVSEE